MPSTPRYWPELVNVLAEYMEKYSDETPPEALTVGVQDEDGAEYQINSFEVLNGQFYIIVQPPVDLAAQELANRIRTILDHRIGYPPLANDIALRHIAELVGRS